LLAANVLLFFELDKWEIRSFDWGKMQMCESETIFQISHIADCNANALAPIAAEILF